MSFWIPCRDTEGRLYYYAINIPLLLAVPAFGVCLAILLDLAATVPLKALILPACMR